MTTKEKSKTSPESIVRQIKRKTRRKFSAEEKIRIILTGLKGEESITDLCRKEGIHRCKRFRWTKIRFVHRERNRLPDNQLRTALKAVVNHIEEIIRIEQLRPYGRTKVSPG